MWKLKLLGSALLLLAGIGNGALAVGREKEKLAVLDGWIELLRFIQEQIDCYLTPVEELLLLADKALLEQCRCQRKDCGLDAGLQRSAPSLQAESLRLLSAFAKEIGGSYREEQIKRCNYYRQALLSVRQKQAEELRGKSRLYRGMSICAAIGAALLLW